MTVKEFWKSINISQSYERMCGMILTHSVR